MGEGAGLGAAWWLGDGLPLQSCARPELVFSADHERGLDVTAGEAGLEIPSAPEEAAAAFRNDPANSLPRTKLGTGHGLGGPNASQVPAVILGRAEMLLASFDQ